MHHLSPSTDADDMTSSHEGYGIQPLHAQNYSAAIPSNGLLTSSSVMLKEVFNANCAFDGAALVRLLSQSPMVHTLAPDHDSSAGPASSSEVHSKQKALMDSASGTEPFVAQSWELAIPSILYHQGPQLLPRTLDDNNDNPFALLTPSKESFSNTTIPSAAVTSMASIFFPPSASALHQKRRKARKHAARVPRPKNSFMHYRSDVSSMIMIELGMINNKIISKIAAERWNAESEHVKAWYRLKAKRCKEEHAKNHPGYRYAPNKKSGATIAPRSPSVPSVSSTRDSYSSKGDEEDVDNYYRGQSVAVQGSTTKQQIARRSKKATTQGPFSHKINAQWNDGSGQHGVRHVDGSSVGVLGGNEPVHPQSVQSLGYSSTGLDGSAVNGYHGHIKIPLSLVGYPLSEQLYQTMQQNYQQQQHQLPSVSHQLHPLTSIPGFCDQGLSSVPICSVSVDANSSSNAFVDPVSHWMTHQYLDHDYVMEQFGFTGPGSYSSSAKNMDEFEGNELPALTHEAGMLLDDPNQILSRLYFEYYL